MRSRSVNTVKIEGFSPSDAHVSLHPLAAHAIGTSLERAPSYLIPTKREKKNSWTACGSEQLLYTISQEELQIKHGSGHERHSCKQAARMHAVFRQPIRSNPFSCAHLSEMIQFSPLKLGGGGPRTCPAARSSQYTFRSKKR